MLIHYQGSFQLLILEFKTVILRTKTMKHSAAVISLNIVVLILLLGYIWYFLIQLVLFVRSNSKYLSAPRKESFPEALPVSLSSVL